MMSLPRLVCGLAVVTALFAPATLSAAPPTPTPAPAPAPDPGPSPVLRAQAAALAALGKIDIAHCSHASGPSSASSAVVTFDTAGAVQDLAFTKDSPYHGTPRGICVKSSLMKAKTSTGPAVTVTFGFSVP